MITFQVERLADMLDEMKPLFTFHWEEIALFKDQIELDPDYDKYLTMERNGNVHVCTARDDGDLVGYFVAFIMPHLHYKQSFTLASDIYYLKPEYRKGRTGLNFFKFCEQEWKKIGVQVAYVGAKVSNDITKVWQHLGFEIVENKMGKLL